MEEDKAPFYRYVHTLLAYPRRLLITILVGNESVNITIAVLATSIFLYFMGPGGKWVSIAVTTITLLIFGEAIPKTYAVSYPMKFSVGVSVPLTLFSKAGRPVVWLLEKISDFFVYLFGKGISATDTVLTEDEFISLVDVGHEEGALEESQRDLIHRVFKLADTSVSEVMTPRVDMFCLPLSMDFRKMAAQVITARYSRVPIYENDRDDIIGILHVRELLEHISEERSPGLVKKLLQKPYYIPLERTTESLLRDFQVRRIQMAVVVDEYGGVAGLVTLNDILENIVGDIYDEDDIREHLVHRVSDGSLIVSASITIEEFNDLTDALLPLEDYETLGGFIFHLFGELPMTGAEVSYEDQIFRVEKISKTRILSLRVRDMRNSDDE